MVIQVTLQDLMFILVCAIGIAAGIILLPTLWNIRKIVNIVLPLVETNQEIIKKTIKTLPGIFENIGQISSDVRETTDNLKIKVPVILLEVENATHAAKESIGFAGAVVENIGSGINETVASYKKDTPGFMSYFHIFKEILQIVYHTLSSGKYSL